MENEASIADRPSGSIWRYLGWGSAVALILAPLAAMQFTREVNWTPMDFAFATVLIGSVGLVLELAVRKTRNGYYRTAVAAALLAGFVEIWVNGAVGIVGDGENPVTLLFSAIPFLALAGAVVVRGRTTSMALMMYWMAALQAVIAIVTYAMFRDNGSLITLVFAGLWILSGLSFGRAARS